jgi:BNR repeat-like domain
VRIVLTAAAGTLVVAAIIVGVASNGSSPSSGEPESEPSGAAAGEEVEEAGEQVRGRLEALEQAREDGTLGLIAPLNVRAAPGWSGQQLWHPKADDWEPAVAGRPGRSRVVMLTTRYGGKPACGNCPEPAIAMRISKDGGAHWRGGRHLCPCRGSKAQYDPEIELDAHGSLHAAWLDGFDPGVTYSRSDDGGRTWTRPVAVDKQLSFSDKPIVAVSDDGQDVYIAFNGPPHGAAWVAVSHDGGDHFSRPVLAEQNGRYHFAGGGTVSSDGTVAFGQTSYNQESTGDVRVVATTSVDGGQHWRNVEVDRVAKQPNCVSDGCPPDFYGPQAAMAGDADEGLLILYQGASQPNGPQRMYARHSGDGGLVWSDRVRISPKHANAAFPAAVGEEPGDFRVWFMDDRRQHDDRWNVWYRESTDGGDAWSQSLRLSDAIRGTSYVKRSGFLEPYGDYGEIAIVGNDETFAVWGEGSSYAGPGGTWFNRTR